MSQPIGAGTLSPKPKHIKADVDEAAPYYKAEYIIICASNILCDQSYPESYNKMLTQTGSFDTVFVAKHTGWPHDPDEESSSELEPEVII